MNRNYPKNAKVIRAGKNAHHFLYYVNGKLHTLQTFKDEIQSTAASLFGFIGQLRTSGNFIKLSAIATLLCSETALALPQDGQSISGNVRFSQNGNTLNVSSAAARSIANYRSFSIGSNERVNFNLPSASAAILNRVTGGDASQILGNMSSNGRIFLVNPNGVFIGQGANINAGGLFATTLNIKDNDFLNHNLVFYKDSNHAPASVVNEGTINITSGGFAALVGSAVSNTGNINVPLGNIQLAVGDQVKAAISDVTLVDLKVTESLKNKVDGITTAISNSGSLIADGGIVKLQADLTRNVYQQAINQEGMIRAQSVQNKNGVIELLGTSDEQNALVMNTGTLDASGYDKKETGGTVHVLGDNVALSGNSKIDASGDAGGGQVRIGGDFQGKGDLYNAQRTLVGEHAQIQNNAVTTGNGGKTIVWADDATFYYGNISAKGGNQSGNGGFVETSGKNGLDFRGLVDTTASKGTIGQTLLDPLNLTIVESGGTNVVSDATFANQPTTNMTINASNVNAVGATSDVTLQANNNLTFNNTATPISMASHNLTGQAGNNITVNGLLTANQIKLEAGNNINVNRNIQGTNVVTLTADAALPTIPVSTVPNDVGNINLAANIASSSTDAPVILGGVNVTQTAGAVTGRLLRVNLHGGGDAILTQPNNDVGALSALASGPNTQNSTLSYTDKNNIQTAALNPGAAVDMGNGNLILTLLNGGSIIGFPFTSTIRANRLDINLEGGGSAHFIERRTISHDVNIFAANATSATSSVSFSDIDGFAVDTSNLRQGSLSLSAINGGSITQIGPVTANHLGVGVAGGGDVTLTRTDNNINTFSASTTVPIPGFPTPPPVNTQNTVINFTNAHGFGVTNASLNSGNLILTALNGGNITQSGAITGNSLSVRVDGGGDATLTRADNSFNIFTANATGNHAPDSSISYRDTNGFQMNSSNLNQGDLNLTALNGGSITQSGPIHADQLSITLDGGGDATLNRADNNVNTLAANATGANTQNTVINYTDANGFAIANANLANGNLSLTALGGGNITQTGAIKGNRLIVTMDGGGDAQLDSNANNFNIFSANALGANTQNTEIAYIDTNGFSIHRSNLQGGTLRLFALNGGNITQNQAITGNNLFVTVVNGGDATLTNTNNSVRTFATNAFGGNTQFSTISYTNNGTFNLGESSLQNATLVLKALNGGDITQSGSIQGGKVNINLTQFGTASLSDSGNTFRSFSGNGPDANFFIQNTGPLTLLSSNVSNINLSTTGLLTIPTGQTVDSKNFLDFRSSDLNILGHIEGDFVRLAPIIPTTTIGLGGGAGAYQLSNAELNRISSPTFGAEIGNRETSGNITLGSINLSNNPIDFAVNTTGLIKDGTPGNDSTYNLILAPNQTARFLGQDAGPLAHPPFTQGAKQIGAPGLGDLDVSFSGTSEAIVHIQDFFGTGTSFNVMTPLGGVYLNVPPEP